MRLNFLNYFSQLTECNTENKVRMSGNQKERKMGSVCVELSEDLIKPGDENVLTKETILDISDTQC